MARRKVASALVAGARSRAADRKPSGTVLAPHAVPAGAASPSGWTSLAVLGLTLAVFGAYWPVRQHGAIPFDDPSYVTDNPRVLAGLTWEGARWAFGSVHAHNWHPLTWLSHMLDVELFGLDLGRHHLTSVALHAGAAALLLVFLVGATGTTWPSLAVATVFALHPLRVESVAWLAERKDTLSALLFVLVLVCWTRYLKQTTPRGRGAWYSASLGGYALGLLAKPMLVSLPVVLLLLDAWPFARWRGSAERARDGDGPGRRAETPGLGSSVSPWRLLLEKLPFFGLATLVALGTLYAQQGVTKSLDSHPLQDRLITAVTSCWVYLGKLAWPRDLAILYPYDAARWESGTVLALGAGLLASTALAVGQARRRGYLCTGWLWYLATLMPVLGLVQVGLQARADRYTYLPSIGVLIAAIWGVRELAVRAIPAAGVRHALAAAALVTLALVLARGTREQLSLWQDPAMLYAHAAEVTRDNEWAHYNLAQVLLRRGDDAGAQRHFHEVTRITPDHPAAWRNLGAIAARAGRREEALEGFARAARASPGDPHARRDLGEALLAMDRLEAAAEAFQRALELRPEDSAARYLLGTVRIRQDQIEEGVVLLHRALELDPAHPGAHNALGVVAARQGDLERAARHFVEALRHDPEYAEARRNLELLAATSGSG
ncbi:MAG TPA: tetratricopeptide repeat protein [Thermoanaerobaculia bacterium]|nr:tetratricopeptide repeat protein [Thermoanaerobaculia bacterium]